MRGVWILLEHMKWKKGTDGGGVGRRKKRERGYVFTYSLLCSSHIGGDSRERLNFCPEVMKKKKKNSERALTLEDI